jgi:uridine phosphorylase
MNDPLPLLDHPLDSPSAFTAEAVMQAVRIERKLLEEPIPQVCVLEFDGDLTDWLVSRNIVRKWNSWACFHTTMFSFEEDGVECGIVPRTIGGAYSVLIAEQMAAAGARVVLGLTSAGRVSPQMPVPGLVVATSAIRDEGTSYHYLSPATTVEAPLRAAESLKTELMKLSLPVRSGTVWTTDAPYRETEKQLVRYAEAGVLAVEMQAASLFAFSVARKFPLGIVAHVTNSVKETSNSFEKGSHEEEFEILQAICRAGKNILT